MKKTEIGLISEDWEVKKLGDHFQLKARIGWQGLTTAEYLESGDYYLVTGTDFKNGYIDWDNCVNVEKSRYDQDRFIQLKAGDVLITKDGTIGKVAFVNKLIKPTTLNSGVFVLRSQNANIDNQFMYYILMSFYFDDFLKKITAGSTINHLYQKDFVHFKFVVPPLPQQQAIAKTLSDADEWIGNLEKLIAKKRSLKQGAIKKLFDPNNDWKLYKLGSLVKIVSGESPSKFTFVDKGLPYFKVEQLNNGRKYAEETPFFIEHSNNYVSKNSIIFPKRGASIFLNKIRILKQDSFFDTNLMSLTPSDLVNTQFLFYSLLNFGLDKIADTTSIPQINNKHIQPIEIFLPPLLVQSYIADILAKMDAELEVIESKQNKALQIKQGIMQQLLTGNVRLINSDNQHINATPQKHNEHFEDAVLIGVLAHFFATPNFPLTRFKYTKVSYLLKRYKKYQANGYLKKAAGPYKPQTRYGGAEKIAITKTYVATQKAVYKGQEFEGFVASENIAEALHYFNEWYGGDSITWMEQFKFEKNDHLELWATVDMAVEELKIENKIINVASVKQFLKSNKEWQAKLTRPIFSDDNIQKAIIKLDTLFD
jgi:type I restriction enzyme S subunit